MSEPVAQTAQTHAVVSAALVPVRSEPETRAEQTSQETLGSVLSVGERAGQWLHCRGEDTYEGWVNEGGLLLRDAAGAEAWWDDAGGVVAVSLDAILQDTSGDVLMRLPWGARVSLAGELVHLPDGRTARVVAGRCVRWDEQSADYPQTGAGVIATAREWMGVPYLWGADCSGYVQAVYRLHGFLLPRDSYQQAEIGEPVEPGRLLEEVQPGDLIYFRDSDSSCVAHVGLSLGGPRVLHAAEPNGCVGENDLSGESDLERDLFERIVDVRRIFWTS